MRKFSQATESEGEAFRRTACTQRLRVQCASAGRLKPITHPHPNPLPEGEGLTDKDTSIGEFPKCTEDDRAWRKEFSPGALLSVTFLGRARKATKKSFFNDPHKSQKTRFYKCIYSIHIIEVKQFTVSHGYIAIVY